MPVLKSSNSFWETTANATGRAVLDKNLNQKDKDRNEKVESGEVRNREVENGVL